MSFDAFSPNEHGWPNSATKDVYDHLTSIDSTRVRMTTEKVKGPPTEALSTFRGWFDLNKRWFLEGNRSSRDREAFDLLFQHWVSDPARLIPWREVIALLHEGGVQGTDLYTQFVAGLAHADWLETLEDCQTAEDTCLREWFEDQVSLWATTPTLRRTTGFLTQMARSVIEYYYQAVDWEYVVKQLRAD